MKVVKAESDRKFDESTKGRKWQEKKSFLVLHFQELKIYSGRLIGQHLTQVTLKMHEGKHLGQNVTKGYTKNERGKNSSAKLD